MPVLHLLFGWPRALLVIVQNLIDLIIQMGFWSVPFFGQSRFVQPPLYVYTFKNFREFSLQEIQKHLSCYRLELKTSHVLLNKSIEAFLPYYIFTFLQEETTLIVWDHSSEGIGILFTTRRSEEHTSELQSQS